MIRGGGSFRGGNNFRGGGSFRGGNNFRGGGFRDGRLYNNRRIYGGNNFFFGLNYGYSPWFYGPGYYWDYGYPALYYGYHTHTVIRHMILTTVRSLLRRPIRVSVQLQRARAAAGQPGPIAAPRVDPPPCSSQQLADGQWHRFGEARTAQRAHAIVFHSRDHRSTVPQSDIPDCLC